MAQSGSGATRRFHRVKPSSPSGRDGLILGDRRKDRAERHVVGIGREPPFEFGLVAGRDAELEARLADGGEIRRVEVLLAEVHPLRALVDGDRQSSLTTSVAPALRQKASAVARLAREGRLVGVLDAELDSRAPTPTRRPTQAALSTIG